ncbi:NmrA family transcriptional regulator [Xylariaceae sp. FL0594]|nr:NmrA family transcriptional regulator [Xylariaceae sp. FL0594]
MVVVAIAGGTGGVGRATVDAIEKAGRHKAIILSRTTSDDPKRFAVDYGDVESIKQVLQENDVAVVVSALLLSGKAEARSQINLIKAAAQSGTVTKFIPSEYYIDFHLPIPGSDLFTDFPLEAEEELSRHPQLTWTLIRVGIFLDHLAMPYNPKTTYISPYWVFLDMEHEECVIPGDGSSPLVLTHSTDLAAYIERLIGLPAEDWPRECFVASNKLQVKDLATLAKRVTGKDFKLTYDTLQAIYDSRITPLPSNRPVFEDPAKGPMFLQVERHVMLSVLTGAHNLPGKDLAEVFPDVPRTDIEEFFRAGWALKQGNTTSS